MTARVEVQRCSLFVRNGSAVCSLCHETVTAGEKGVRHECQYSAPDPRDKYPLVFTWSASLGMDVLPGRKGQRCRIVRAGQMNSRIVEFEDGFRAIVSGQALRKAK